ncbi:MAG: hypothetical protein JXR97_15270 [Planctomycetes bacterium]|nr:hypothetical protein [Planctomycetota bacterium]
MATPILLMVVTGCMWSALGVVMLTVNRRGIPAVDYYGLGALAAVFTSLATLVRWDQINWLDPRLMHMAFYLVGGGIINSIAQVMIIVNLGRGPKAPIWAISQSAMVIPFLTGLIAFDERLSAAGGAGILLLLFALAILGQPKKRITENQEQSTASNWFLFAAATMILLGISQAIVALPSRWENFSDSGNLRTPLTCFGSFIGMTMVKLGRRKNYSLDGIGLCACFAVLATLSYWLLFKAMDLLALVQMTGIAFPLGIGTCITAFSVYTWIVEKVPIAKREVFGVLCTVGGIALMSCSSAPKEEKAKAFEIDQRPADLEQSRIKAESSYSTDEERGHIDGVRVEGEFTHSLFKGSDKDHLANNIVFSNLTSKGKAITSLDQLNATRENCGSITLKP